MTKQKQIILLSRFIGYIGVSTSTLILPILVYKITGSPSLAGLTMLIEWVPKFLMYIYGGQLIQKIGINKAYFWIDLLRAITFVLFLIAVSFNNKNFLFLAAPIMQGCNGLSNLVFESLVTSWWKEEDHVSGYSQLFYLDLSATIIMMPLISLLPLNAILILGIIVFCINFLVGLWSRYEHLVPLSRLNSKGFNVFKNVGEIRSNKPLASCSLIGLSVTIPFVLINTQMFFFLTHFENNITNFVSFISNYKAALLICSIIVLSFLKKVKDPIKILLFSYFLIYSSLIALCFSKSMNTFLISFMVYTLGFHSFVIFNKSYRQKIISKDKRLQFTGLLASLEAISYIIAAFLFIIFSYNIKIAFLICLLVITLMFFKIPDVIRQEKRVKRRQLKKELMTTS
jgi:Na+/melibiose symporter-like transporter